MYKVEYIRIHTYLDHISQQVSVPYSRQPKLWNALLCREEYHILLTVVHAVSTLMATYVHFYCHCLKRHPPPKDMSVILQ